MSAKSMEVSNWPRPMGKETQRILGLVSTCRLDRGCRPEIPGNDEAMDAFAVHALKSQLAVFGDTDHMHSRMCPVGPRFSHELKLQLAEQRDEERESGREIPNGSKPSTFVASSSSDDWHPKPEIET